MRVYILLCNIVNVLKRFIYFVIFDRKYKGVSESESETNVFEGYVPRSAFPADFE